LGAARLGKLSLGQLSIAAAVAALPAFAHAQSTNWTNGASDGSWSNPANWDNGVPANGYSVNITTATNSTTVNYDYTGPAITLGTLTLSVSSPATGTTTDLLTISANNLNVGTEFVGSSSPNAGSGTISQTGGSNNLGSILHLGFSSKDNGTYTLSGTGVLTAIGGENIGASGTGLFVQSAGSNYVGGKFNSALNIGTNPNSNGTYALSGTGTLTFDGDGVGGAGEIVGNQGIGLFNQSGGVNNVTSATDSGDTLVIGDFNSANGTYILSAGSLNVMGISPAEEIGIGGKGTFNQTGGINNLTGSAALMRVQSSTGASSYNLSGGSLAISGSGAALQIATFSNFNLSGLGTLSVSGTGANEVIGFANNGSYIQTGGSNTISGAASFLAVGYPGSTGSLAISGGTTTVGGNMYVGGNATGTAGLGATASVTGMGILNVSGTLTVYNVSGTAITLAGGTVNTAALNFNGSSANVWSSGTLGLTAGLTFDSLAPTNSTSGAFGSALALNGSQTLNVIGNETIGGTGAFSLTLGAGSIDTDTGTFTVKAGSTLAMSASTLAIVGSLSDSGITTLGGVVSSTAGQTFAAVVQMGGPSVLLSDPSGAISFGSTVSGSTTALTVSATGGVSFGAPVNLKSLSILSGTASLAVTTTVSANIEFIGGATGGAFNQTAGSNTISNELDIAPVGSGRYTLSGGTLAAPNIYIGGTSAGSGGTGVLTINNTGQLSLPGTLKVWSHSRANLDVATTNVGALAIDSNAIVNLNGRLNINYGSPANDPVTTIVSYLKSGYNGGPWNGTSGLISTSITPGSPALALGYADGNTDTGTPAAANQIMVKYTLAGDANLDGLVNFNDLVAVVQNFNKSGTDWAHGDFHFGTSTNFNDLVTVVQNFNKVLPPPAGTAVEIGANTIPLGQSVQIQETAVPEPGGVSIMLMAGTFLARRRRRAKTEPRIAG
jgi:hypothetical protein